VAGRPFYESRRSGVKALAALAQRHGEFERAAKEENLNAEGAEK